METAYDIYRDHLIDIRNDGVYRELIGRLHLETAIEIHGKNVSGICEITKQVTVRS